MLGVSKKQKDGMLATRTLPPKNYDYGDYVEHEETAEYSKIGIVTGGVYGGTILRPLYTSRGLRFINAEYLEPLKDDKGTLTPYERIGTNGQSYMAIKRNSWLIPSVCDGTKTDLLRRCNFIKNMLKYVGVPLFDDRLIQEYQSYRDYAVR